MNIPQPYTKYRSITDSIRLWRVIRDNGYVRKEIAINVLGEDFFYIIDMLHHCPLCYKRTYTAQGKLISLFKLKSCEDYCALKSCGVVKDHSYSIYQLWANATTKTDRKKYAGMIVDKLERYLTHTMKKKMV